MVRFKPCTTPPAELIGTLKGDIPATLRRKRFSPSPSPPISPIRSGMTGRISLMPPGPQPRSMRPQPACARVSPSLSDNCTGRCPCDAGSAGLAAASTSRRESAPAIGRMNWGGRDALGWHGRQRSSEGTVWRAQPRNNCACTASIIHTCITNHVRKVQCLMRRRGNKALMGNMKTI